MVRAKIASEKNQRRFLKMAMIVLLFVDLLVALLIGRLDMTEPSSCTFYTPRLARVGRG